MNQISIFALIGSGIVAVAALWFMYQARRQIEAYKTAKADLDDERDKLESSKSSTSGTSDEDVEELKEDLAEARKDIKDLKQKKYDLEQEVEEYRESEEEDSSAPNQDTLFDLRNELAETKQQLEEWKQRAESGGGSTEAETTTATPRPTGAPPTASGSLPVQHSLSTLREKVVSGGVGKDGIPSIDDPTFGDAAGADEWLDPEDVVFGVVRGGDVRAYPQRILVWHEIVNDELDGVPVSVTYCPLTGTAMGYLRGSTTFGVSGRLVNSNLVMYDRETDSRWPQILGTAIDGEFETASLLEFPVVWTTWERWREAHPDTAVLTRETGYARDYARDPYGDYNPKRGYYARDDTLFERLTDDGRQEAKDVVLGARTADLTFAVTMSRLRTDGVVPAEDGRSLAVYDPTFDHGYVYRTPDGDADEYGRDGGRVRGPEGVSDPEALSLDRVTAFQAMWFAWSGFYPEAALYE